MAKKCTTIIFDADVVESVEKLMIDEDRPQFGPAINTVLRRYFKMRSANGVNKK